MTKRAAIILVSFFLGLLVSTLTSPSFKQSLAQDDVSITIFVDEDTLVVFVPGNQSVSLERLGFEVVIDNTRQIFSLNQFTSFQAIHFDTVTPPICFRLARDGSRRSLPLECDPSRTLTQNLASANVFWYDSMSNQTRTFTVVSGTTPITFCAAGQARCELVYVIPTPAPTPDLLLVTLELARHFSGNNHDWTPVVEQFDGVEMVLVPAGCFMMGSTDAQIETAFQQCKSEQGTENCERNWFEAEIPMHQVCLTEPFWIDRTEVTNTQFAEFGGQTVLASNWTDDNRPREQITWTEAQAFCEKRGSRLPTEAEWEYAARGPENWLYPWGNEFIADNVVYGGNSGEQTAVVGSKPEGMSWVGALDLSGNVWEWVSNWYEPYFATQQTDPIGPPSGDYRVLRGGSWSDTYTVVLRSSDRFIIGLNDRNHDYIGFRCVRNAEG